MKYPFQKKHPGCPSEELNLLLSKVGGKVSDELIELLEYSNGGELLTDRCLFKYRSGYDPDEIERTCLEEIYSAKGILKTAYLMSISLKDSDFLPLGPTSTGDVLMLRCKMEDVGAVYLFEAEKDFGRVINPKTKLANTIQNLFKVLVKWDVDFDDVSICNEDFS